MVSQEVKNDARLYINENEKEETFWEKEICKNLIADTSLRFRSEHDYINVSNIDQIISM